MQEPCVVAFDLGDSIRISPPLWPNNNLQVQPGDLTQFAPYGNGVYGYQSSGRLNPLKGAPPQEAVGGALYFGNQIVQLDFEVLMRIVGVSDRRSRDYSVFVAESDKPGEDGYLRQVRLVSKFALRFMFGAINDAEYERFPTQLLTMPETLWSFMQHERKAWGTSFGNPSLAGKFGGDGHFAQEELAFGFMVENDYHGVYRIWSRAWLVTK